MATEGQQAGARRRGPGPTQKCLPALQGLSDRELTIGVAGWPSSFPKGHFQLVLVTETYDGHDRLAGGQEAGEEWPVPTVFKR